MKKRLLKIFAFLYIASAGVLPRAQAENILTLKTYLTEPRQAFSRLTLIDDNLSTASDRPSSCSEGDFFFDKKIDENTDQPLLEKWYCDGSSQWQDLNNPWTQEYDEDSDVYTTYLTSCYNGDADSCALSIVLINPLDYTDTLTEQDDIDNLNTNQPSLTKIGTAGFLAEDKCYSVFWGDDDPTDTDNSVKPICDLNEDGNITDDPDEYALDALPDFAQSDGTADEEFPRMFWWPAKAAFRAGGTDSDYEAWDDNINDTLADNIGEDSVAFGYNNLASGEASSILGGSDNSTTADYSIIGGGFQNTIEESATDLSNHSIIMGGHDNTISASHHSVIGAGSDNTIELASNYASIGAGKNNRITSSGYGIIGAGLNGTISTSSYSFIGSGQDNIITRGTYNTILGGKDNAFQTLLTTAAYNLIGGGGDTDEGNLIEVGLSGNYNSILSGKKNSICGAQCGQGSAVGGGITHYSTIAGGEENIIQNGSSDKSLSYVTILGGFNNYFAAKPASDLAAFVSILGGANNAITKDTTANGWPNYTGYLNNITILGGEKNVIMEPEYGSGTSTGHVTLGGSTSYGVFPGSDSEDLITCAAAHTCQDPLSSVTIEPGYASHAFIWHHDVIYAASTNPSDPPADSVDIITLNSSTPSVLIAYSDFVDLGADGHANGNDKRQKMKVGVNFINPKQPLEIATSNPNISIAFTGEAIVQRTYNDNCNTNSGCSLLGTSTILDAGGPSDRRLKENIQPIDNALETLLSLRGVEFDWKNPEHKLNGEMRQVGMIAQEVEIIEPDWVAENAAGIKRLNFGMGFYALATEAIRELDAEVSQELDAVDDDIAEMQKKIDKLSL